MSITTITTFVPVVDEGEIQRQLRKLGERDDELTRYGMAGWGLSHTATITGPEFITFVDTLTKTN